MTTIAVADGVVAADTQLTGGNYAVRVEKVVRLQDGGVAAACGLWHKAYPAMRWLAEGERGDGPDFEGATIVIVRPDHTIWVAEESFPAYPILNRTYALGSGQDLARQLLSQGKSPVDAVAEACELDAFSSDPIMSMTVQDVAEFAPASVHKVKRSRAKTV